MIFFEILIWLKWKYKELTEKFLYFVLYRALWKKMANAESDDASWEITHHSQQKTVTLHYVIEDDYSDNDVKINLSYPEFEDLVKFMIKIR